MLVDFFDTPNVYFQPPESILMKYPAVRYSILDISNVTANNKKYVQNKAYKLIIIDEDPDSVLVEKASQLPMCSFSNHYTIDGLYHTVFKLYY